MYINIPFNSIDTFNTLSVCLAGLFSGPLVQRFGCRKVTLVSISLSAAGHVIAAFSSNQMVIYVAFGLLSGNVHSLRACY